MTPTLNIRFRYWPFSAQTTRAGCLLLSLIFILPSLLWAFEPPVLRPSLSSLIYRNQPITIPKALGQIKARHASTGPLIVHIQDLHCHYEVQQNIARLIERLAQEHSLRLVAVEGAAGSVDVSTLATFPDRVVRQRAAEYFMRQGKISGPEFYAACGSRPVRLVGVEDPDLFAANHASAKQLMTAESLGLVLDLRQALEALKPALYSKELATFDRHRTRFRAGQESLADYAQAVLRAARRQRLDGQAYPALARYAQAPSQTMAADEVESLEAELSQLDRVVRRPWHVAGHSETFDQFLDRLDTVERLMNISATPADLAAFYAAPQHYSVKTFIDFMAAQTQPEARADPDLLRLDHYLDLARQFYGQADQRSELFVEHLAGQLKQTNDTLAVLVTGGFHTQKILDEIAARGWSYLSIQPRLEHPDLINPYFSLLQKRSSSLEELLARNQNILNLGSYFPTAALQPAAGNRQAEAVRGFVRLLDLALKYLLASRQLDAALSPQASAQAEEETLKDFSANNAKIKLAWSKVRYWPQQRWLAIPETQTGIQALIARDVPEDLRKQAAHVIPAWGRRDILIFKPGELETALADLSSTSQGWDQFTREAALRILARLSPATIRLFVTPALAWGEKAFGSLRRQIRDRFDNREAPIAYLSVSNIAWAWAGYAFTAGFWGPWYAPVAVSAFFGMQMAMVITIWARFNSAQGEEHWESFGGWLVRTGGGRLADTGPQDLYRIYRHYAGGINRRWIRWHEIAEDMLPLRYLPLIGRLLNHLLIAPLDMLFVMGGVLAWAWDLVHDWPFQRLGRQRTTVQISPDQAGLSQIAAEYAAFRIREKINTDGHCNLGLTTGSALNALYQQWRENPAKYNIDWAKVRIFQIGELLGLENDSSLSDQALIREQIAKPLEIPEDQLHFFNPEANDLNQEAERYNASIQRVRGLDLLLLDVGTTGELPYQEPGSSLRSKCGVTRLSAPTRKKLGDLSPATNPPSRALSIGLSHVLGSGEMILLASGLATSPALADALAGPVTRRVPASITQLHQRAIVFADLGAAASLSAAQRRQAGSSSSELLMALALSQIPLEARQKIVAEFDELIKQGQIDAADLLSLEQRKFGYTPAAKKRLADFFQKSVPAFHARIEADYFSGSFPQELKIFFWMWLVLNQHYKHDLEYTFSHVWNIGHLSAGMGQQANIKPDRIERFRQAGWLHDAGKLFVPLKILHKSQNFSDEDYALIKEHAWLGHEFLQALGFEGELLDSTLHHERLNGRGYYQGLKGDKVPMVARILALADSWNAAMMRGKITSEKLLDEFQTMSVPENQHYDQYWADIISQSPRDLVDTPHGLFAQEAPKHTRQIGQTLALFWSRPVQGGRKPAGQIETSLANRLRKKQVDYWITEPLLQALQKATETFLRPGIRLETWWADSTSELLESIRKASKVGTDPNQMILARVIEPLSDDRVRIFVVADRLSVLENLQGNLSASKPDFLLAANPPQLALILEADSATQEIDFQLIMLSTALRRQGLGKNFYAQLVQALSAQMPGYRIHGDVIHPAAVKNFAREFHADVDWERLTEADQKQWQTILRFLEPETDGPLNTIQDVVQAVRRLKAVQKRQGQSDAEFLLDYLISKVDQVVYNLENFKSFLQKNFSAEEQNYILQNGTQDLFDLYHRIFIQVFRSVPMMAQLSAGQPITEAPSLRERVLASWQRLPTRLNQWFKLIRPAVYQLATIYAYPAGKWTDLLFGVLGITYRIQPAAYLQSREKEGFKAQAAVLMTDSVEEWLSTPVLAAIKKSQDDQTFFPIWTINQTSEIDEKIRQNRSRISDSPDRASGILRLIQPLDDGVRIWLISDTLDKLGNFANQTPEQIRTSLALESAPLAIMLEFHQKDQVVVFERFQISDAMKKAIPLKALIAALHQQTGRNFGRAQKVVRVTDPWLLHDLSSGLDVDIAWELLTPNSLEKWVAGLQQLGIIGQDTADWDALKLRTALDGMDFSGQPKTVAGALFQSVQSRLENISDQEWERLVTTFAANDLERGQALAEWHDTSKKILRFWSWFFKSLLLSDASHPMPAAQVRQIKLENLTGLGLWPWLLPLYHHIAAWAEKRIGKIAGLFFGLVLAPAVIESGGIGLLVLAGAGLISRIFGLPFEIGPPLVMFAMAGLLVWHGLHVLASRTKTWPESIRRAFTPATVKMSIWTLLGLGLASLVPASPITVFGFVLTSFVVPHIIIQIYQLRQFLSSGRLPASVDEPGTAARRSMDFREAGQTYYRRPGAGARLWRLLLSHLLFSDHRPGTALQVRLAGSLGWLVRRGLRLGLKAGNAGPWSVREVYPDTHPAMVQLLREHGLPNETELEFIARQGLPLRRLLIRPMPAGQTGLGYYSAQGASLPGRPGLYPTVYVAPALYRSLGQPQGLRGRMNRSLLGLVVNRLTANYQQQQQAAFKLEMLRTGWNQRAEQAGSSLTRAVLRLSLRRVNRWPALWQAPLHRFWQGWQPRAYLQVLLEEDASPLAQALQTGVALEYKTYWVWARSGDPAARELWVDTLVKHLETQGHAADQWSTAGWLDSMATFSRLSTAMPSLKASQAGFWTEGERSGQTYFLPGIYPEHSRQNRRMRRLLRLMPVEREFDDQRAPQPRFKRMGQSA